MSRAAGRRWWRPLVGAGVALLFLWLLARGVEWATVAGLLADAAPGPLVLALGALGAGLAIRILRWWWMLRVFDPTLRYGSCVRPFLGSLALNNTVPLRAGDVVRAVGFRHALRASPARVVGTLVVERLLDLLVLLVIFFLALLGAAEVFPRPFLAAGALAAALAGAVLLVLIAAPGVLVAAADRMVAWPRLPEGLRARLAPHVRQLAESLTVLRAPGRAAGLLGLSLLAWIAEGGVFAGVAWSLGLAAPWPAAWLALGAATLATLLPSTPGYVGTFDYFATLGFTAYGVGHSAAAAGALLAHLVVWLPVTLVGLAALALQRAPAAPPLEAEAA